MRDSDIVTLLDQSGKVIWQLDYSVVYASAPNLLLLGARNTLQSDFVYEVVPISDPATASRLRLPSEPSPSAGR